MESLTLIADAAVCACPSCAAGLAHDDDGGPGRPAAVSLDPQAGGSANGKPLWDFGTVAGYLNRTGYDWYTNNYGELDDGILNYGFWLSQQELASSYYVNVAGTIAFGNISASPRSMPGSVRWRSVPSCCGTI